MRIHPQGCGNVLMAQSLADSDDVHTISDQPRSMRVPEIVQSDRLHSADFDTFAEVITDDGRR